MMNRLRKFQAKCEYYFSDEYVPKPTPWWKYTLVFGIPTSYFLIHVIVAVANGWI